MTLLTKGMGAIIRGITKPKTNKPLYSAVGIALAQKVLREKLKSKKKKKDKE